MAGSCLATDVYGDRPGEDDIYECYQNAVRQIRAMTIDFLAGNLDYVREKGDHWKREFAFAVTGILGEQKLAYMLFLSNFDSCYIVCPGCGNCDEEIEFGYFYLLEDEEGAERLRYYFGTYVCPECGKKVPVLTGMEEYFLAE